MSDNTLAAKSCAMEEALVHHQREIDVLVAEDEQPEREILDKKARNRRYESHRKSKKRSRKSEAMLEELKKRVVELQPKAAEKLCEV